MMARFWARAWVLVGVWGMVAGCSGDAGQSGARDTLGETADAYVGPVDDATEDSAPQDAEAGASYAVRVTYYGEPTTRSGATAARRSVERIDVLLFAAEGDCDGVVASWDPSVSPVPAAVADSAVRQTLAVEPDGSIPEESVTSPPGVVFTHAIARAEGSTTADESARHWVAFGCVDGISARKADTPIPVEIDMWNLWPDTAADYELVTTLTLTDFIPDGVQPTFDTLLDLVENPALGLMLAVSRIFLDDAERVPAVECNDQQACRTLSHEPGYEGHCAPSAVDASRNVCWEREQLDSAALAGLVDLFHTCSTEDLVGETAYSASCNRTGQIVASATMAPLFDTINDMLQSEIEAYIPFGGTAVDVFEAIQDGARNLRSFRLKGQLQVTADPGRDGVASAAGALVFDEIEVTWEGQDAAGNAVARTRSMRLAQLGRPLIQSTGVSLTVALDETAGAYVLSLSPFDVNVNYGEVVLFALEALVLPGATGCGALDDAQPCIHSLADLMGWLTGDSCSDLASELTGAVGGLPDAFCDTVTAALGASLERWRGALTIGTGATFQMFTPTDAPCRIGFPEGGPPPFSVVSLGSADSGCVFGAEVRFDPAAVEGEAVDATWYATAER